MIKVAAVLLFVISLTSALRNPTSHIIQQEVFLKRLVERQSSCGSILAHCNDTVSLDQQSGLTANEAIARYLSARTVIECGSCFDEYESYHRCISGDDGAEWFREAKCARSDIDGKYCLQSLYDGIVNRDIPYCDAKRDVCVATCQDLQTLQRYLGCCTTSFEQYGLLPNTTQEYDVCGATLGEPCSDGRSETETTDEPVSVGGPTDGESDSSVSATPTFFAIAVFALITCSVF